MLHINYANRFLNLITAQVKVLNGTGACYIGFSTAHEPKADGSTFSEPDRSIYPSYQRIQVAVTDALIYTDKMGGKDEEGNYTAQAYGGMVTNTSAFASEQCMEEGGWPEFTHFGIFDAKEGGVLIASDALRDAEGNAMTLKISYKEVAVFQKEALQLTLN